MPQRQALSKEERRLRREARRANQRKANLGRARKMHIARLEMEKAVSGQTGRTSIKAAKPFYVGCSGWFYWHWRGGVYPSDLPTKDWFSHYSRCFKTVELNAPFYSWPTVANVQSWVRQAGRRPFVYTVK